MKFSKLLMPALTVVSAGAIVAPIVTSCSKETTVALTEGVAGYYISDTESLFSVSNGGVVKYTGAKMQANATICAIITSCPEKALVKVTKINVNGTDCEVKTVTVPVYGDGYYCELPSGLTAGTELTIKVTYGESYKDCATMLAITAA